MHSISQPSKVAPGCGKSKRAKNVPASSTNSTSVTHGSSSGQTNGSGHPDTFVHASPGSTNRVVLIKVSVTNSNTSLISSNDSGPTQPVRIPLHKTSVASPKRPPLTSSSNSSPSDSTFKFSTTLPPFHNHSANKNVTAEADAAVSAPNANTALKATSTSRVLLISSHLSPWRGPD